MNARVNNGCLASAGLGRGGGGGHSILVHTQRYTVNTIENPDDAEAGQKSLDDGSRIRRSSSCRTRHIVCGATQPMSKTDMRSVTNGPSSS